MEAMLKKNLSSGNIYKLISYACILQIPWGVAAGLPPPSSSPQFLFTHSHCTAVFTISTPPLLYYFFSLPSCLSHPILLASPRILQTRPASLLIPLNPPISTHSISPPASSYPCHLCAPAFSTASFPFPFCSNVFPFMLDEPLNQGKPVEVIPVTQYAKGEVWFLFMNTHQQFPFSIHHNSR